MEQHMKNIKKHIFTTATQKILDFLIANTDKQSTEKEITEKTGVKKSAVNLALKELVKDGLLEKEKIGRTSVHSLSKDHAIIKELKILQNIIQIYPLVEKIKPLSQKIVLFGSSARGTNTTESDIDIFVQSNNPEEIKRIIDSSELKERIQLIVKMPKEMVVINKEKPLIFQEIDKGRILFDNYAK
ncbi:MAG: nucleotidyltransferase domain-containing protein [Candidatus Pacebacteria bacterium]|nr:nucleotidyltransferase domain-containing protein [Candidatus Paceibacterota bacterium]MDD5752972.1 nucleotidyltransferase domain-containing protein [Candidatus Paceibacterota bacterium]